MGIRRQARELAMQALYYMDVNRAISEGMLEQFCRNFPPSPKVQPYFFKLAQGVIQRRVQIDGLIERFSKNWKLERMAHVDRNILRIAVFELVHCADIPPKVAINEAVDIGKRFGTEDSGAFINGIVDSVRLALEKGDLAFGERLSAESAHESDSDVS